MAPKPQKQASPKDSAELNLDIDESELFEAAVEAHDEIDALIYKIEREQVGNEEEEEFDYTEEQAHHDAPDDFLYEDAGSRADRTTAKDIAQRSQDFDDRLKKVITDIRLSAEHTSPELPSWHLSGWHVSFWAFIMRASMMVAYSIISAGFFESVKPILGMAILDLALLRAAAPRWNGRSWKCRAKYEGKSGIYMLIGCSRDGNRWACYVGTTFNISYRFTGHRTKIRQRRRDGKHGAYRKGQLSAHRFLADNDYEVSFHCLATFPPSAYYMYAYLAESAVMILTRSVDMMNVRAKDGTMANLTARYSIPQPHEPLNRQLPMSQRSAGFDSREIECCADGCKTMTVPGSRLVARGSHYAPYDLSSYWCRSCFSRWLTKQSYANPWGYVCSAGCGSTSSVGWYIDKSRKDGKQCASCYRAGMQSRHNATVRQEKAVCHDGCGTTYKDEVDWSKRPIGNGESVWVCVRCAWQAQSLKRAQEAEPCVNCGANTGKDPNWRRDQKGFPPGTVCGVCIRTPDRGKDGVLLFNKSEITSICTRLTPKAIETLRIKRSTIANTGGDFRTLAPIPAPKSGFKRSSPLHPDHDPSHVPKKRRLKCKKCTGTNKKCGHRSDRGYNEKKEEEDV